MHPLRKVLFGAGLVFLLPCGHAQTFRDLLNGMDELPLDTLLARQPKETDPRSKWGLTRSIFVKYMFQGSKEATMTYALSTLEQAEVLGNDSLIALSYLTVGSAFSRVDDVNSTLKYYSIGMDYAELANDDQIRAFLCKEMGIQYARAGDYSTALHFNRRALKLGVTGALRARVMAVLSGSYLALGDLDSAFYCAREADVIREPSEDPYGYAGYQLRLAEVYAARGEPDLSEAYFLRSVNVAESFKLLPALAGSAAGYAKLLTGQGRHEEALLMARKGYEAAMAGGQFSSVVKAAEALANAFSAEQRMDSAFAYMKLTNDYRDSIQVSNNLGRMQANLFSQQLKEREAVRLKGEEAAVRSRNIQYGIITLIVITLGIFLLIFSRTAAVGATAIKNLSLIALLLFFEFINLLLHPLLDRITGHSPLLMILVMAAIAGLLIPLHHRMEHFITNMLVSKNNRVRLEAARRTIEELEARPEDATAD